VVGARAHRRSGPVVLVQESEIRQAREHQWVAVVLLEYWIGVGRRQRLLSTVSRSCGGGPARCSAWERDQWKCQRVKARVSAWEAPGRARGPEEGVVAWEQELASWRESWWLGRRRRNVERRGEDQSEVGAWHMAGEGDRGVG
jgi:hypothetical protein